MHYCISLSMEGNYLKLSQFLYNSYLSPLETTGFLTEIDLLIISCNSIQPSSVSNGEAQNFKSPPNCD